MGNAFLQIESVTSCDSYRWPINGVLYEEQGTYYDSLQTTLGCDSIHVLELKLNSSSPEMTISHAACDSFQWDATNQWYNTSGKFVAEFTNTSGCDSSVILDLTLHESTETFDDVSACFEYTWSVNGKTYVNSGVYSEKLSSQHGCDSLKTINLSIVNVEANVSQDRETLYAQSNDAIFQWLDCNNDLAEISGENYSSFTATENGSYAVRVTQDGCSLIIPCFEVTTVSKHAVDKNQNFSIYPNPVENQLQIECDEIENAHISIFTLDGREIPSKALSISSNQGRITLDVSNLQPGLLLVKVGSVLNLILKK